MAEIPTLTLAVIVKDEAALLARLLAHHRPLVDEMVVVDTGSQDRSPQVAREAGARLERFAWCGDFSAARNLSLDLATGRAILCLDCDELIAPADFPSVRRLAAECAGGRYWILPQNNYTHAAGTVGWEPVTDAAQELTLGAPGFVTAFTPRIWPNLPGLRYEGVVHETVEPAALRLGLQPGQAAIVIHHHGHLLGQKLSARQALYGRLLRRKIRRQPGDPRARYELAAQLVQEGQAALAIRLLRRTVTESPAGPEIHRARLLLGQLLQQAQQPAAALLQFTRALRQRPDWAPAWRAIVAALVTAGRSEAAGRFVERGLRLFPEDSFLRDFAAQVRTPGADNLDNGGKIQPVGVSRR